MRNLLQEFISMEELPYFEVYTEENEWECFPVYGDDEGLGIIGSYTKKVLWNEDFSLEEHLELLYNNLIECEGVL